ncbi:MAG: hypothetical protein QOH03_5527 [Kribbellaceae bacterium]|nr:hypothetical protein [Kribbellaceae bacterium]
MALPRLRQVAFAAADLEAVAGQLRAALGLDEPFRDPGVGYFGLHNAVFAVGDTFLEVVSPTREGTAAGRYLERQGGDTGYMAMVQVADMPAARARLGELGVRVVWDHTEPDIVDLHLHPRDVPGTLLALDAADPEGSWRWGGPAWTAAVPAHRPGGLRELVIAVERPDAVAARWAEVIGSPVDDSTLPMADAAIHFVPPSGRVGIVGLTVAVPDLARTTVDIAGVRIDLVPA